MDLAKAFDTLNDSILLYMLKYYRIRGNALTFVFPSKRNEPTWKNVQVINYVSSKREIVCGVPQGSVLGSPLFLLCINDIKHASKFNVRLFANDNLIYLSSKVAHTLESNINNEIRKIESWLQANMLSINVSKTKYIRPAQLKNGWGHINCRKFAEDRMSIIFALNHWL